MNGLILKIEKLQVKVLYAYKKLNILCVPVVYTLGTRWYTRELTMSQQTFYFNI